MNALEKYVREHKLTRAALAEQVGTTEATISRWCTGRVKPRWEQAAILAKITGGAVPVESWVEDVV